MTALEDVVSLKQDEIVRLDPDRLNEIYIELGEARADDVVCRAMEELAIRLGQVEKHYRHDRLDEMRKATRSLAAIAGQVGMPALARVANDVSTCLAMADPVALAATLSRMLRVGERSLAAIWDMQNLTV